MVITRAPNSILGQDGQSGMDGQVFGRRGTKGTNPPLGRNAVFLFGLSSIFRW